MPRSLYRTGQNPVADAAVRSGHDGMRGAAFELAQVAHGVKAALRRVRPGLLGKRSLESQDEFLIAMAVNGQGGAGRHLQDFGNDRRLAEGQVQG